MLSVRCATYSGKRGKLRHKASFSPDDELPVGKVVGRAAQSIVRAVRKAMLVVTSGREVAAEWYRLPFGTVIICRSCRNIASDSNWPTSIPGRALQSRCWLCGAHAKT